MRETDPIGPPWKVSGEDAQPTKSREAIVRNEANLPADRAKRTQFPAGPGPCGRKMRNEPNSRGGRPRHPESTVQNKANCRRHRPGWGSCTNKPNSWHHPNREIGVPRRAKRAKQSQFLDCGLCKTNPISRVKQRRVRDLARETKPIVPRMVSGSRCPTHEEPRDNRAKQSQFATRRAGVGGTDAAKQSQVPGGAGQEGAPGAWDAGRNVRNKPNCPKRGTEVVSRQGWMGRGPGDGTSILQNEPNSADRPGPRRAKCAKRTQFGPSRLGRAPSRRTKDAKQTQFSAAEIPHHSNIPLFQRSNPMAIVRNKANWPPGAVGGDTPLFQYSIIPPFQSYTVRATSPRCPASGNKANCIWGPLEVGGYVGYHSYPGNRPYTD